MDQLNSNVLFHVMAHVISIHNSNFVKISNLINNNNLIRHVIHIGNEIHIPINSINESENNITQIYIYAHCTLFILVFIVYSDERRCRYPLENYTVLYKWTNVSIYNIIFI